jgi:multimeric flavodoxin WrbA
MRAVIFDGSRREDTVLHSAHAIMRKYLYSMGWNVDSFVLRDLKIAPCLGCFDCWLKTPGICVISDIGRDTTSSVGKSDMLIFITPVVFGGYSSYIKKAVDRILPIFVPVFTRINGEVHHKIRLHRSPRFVGLGYMKDMDGELKDLFGSLISRNAINFHSPVHAGEILTGQDDTLTITAKIKNVLAVSGVVL